jgi:hypothetical protein
VGSDGIPVDRLRDAQGDDLGTGDLSPRSRRVWAGNLVKVTKLAGVRRCGDRQACQGGRGSQSSALPGLGSFTTTCPDSAAPALEHDGRPLRRRRGVRVGPAAREPEGVWRTRVGKASAKSRDCSPRDGQEPVRAGNPASSTADCSLGPRKPLPTSNPASSTADCSLGPGNPLPTSNPASSAADCALKQAQRYLSRVPIARCSASKPPTTPKTGSTNLAGSRKPETGNRKPATSALKGPGDSLHGPQIRGTTHLVSEQK